GRARRIRAEISTRALRRHAPARVALPRADPRSAAAADGRAVRRARRAHPRPARARPAAHLPRAARQRAVHHPHPGPGWRSFRPGDRDDAAPGTGRPADRHRVAAPAHAGDALHAGVLPLLPRDTRSVSRPWRPAGALIPMADSQPSAATPPPIDAVEAGV